MPPLLEVMDLHVSYGRLPALQGIDLVVPERTLVGLLGPNGACKATLLKTVAGLVGSTPVLLMADELSLGLAPLLVQQIADTIARLKEEEGRTILLVEQYATHVMRVADFIFILGRGKVVWAGEPDELRASKVL